MAKTVNSTQTPTPASNPPKKVPTSLSFDPESIIKFFALLIIIFALLLWAKHIYKNWNKEKEWKTVETGIVGPGKSWTTSKVNYHFRLIAKEHAICGKYNGVDEIQCYPPTGTFWMPKGAKSGPIEVSAGEGETSDFEVELQKKIK